VNASAVVPQLPGIKIYKYANNAPESQSVQVIVQGTSGTVSATVQIFGSADGVNWSALGDPITATSTTGYATNNQVMVQPFDYYGAAITALTGPGATVTVNLSV
jgi:hypothetical protein